MKITQAASRTFVRQAARVQSPAFQLQQQRGILGLSQAIDKRLYRMAKGVMPTISATEQTALGWCVVIIICLFLFVCLLVVWSVSILFSGAVLLQ